MYTNVYTYIYRERATIFICRKYVILYAEFRQITCTSRRELIRYEKIRRKWGTKFLYRICIQKNGD